MHVLYLVSIQCYILQIWQMCKWIRINTAHLTFLNFQYCQTREIWYGIPVDFRQGVETEIKIKCICWKNHVFHTRQSLVITVDGYSICNSVTGTVTGTILNLLSPYLENIQHQQYPLQGSHLVAYVFLKIKRENKSKNRDIFTMLVIKVHYLQVVQRENNTSLGCEISIDMYFQNNRISNCAFCQWGHHLTALS